MGLARLEWILSNASVCIYVSLSLNLAACLCVTSLRGMRRVSTLSLRLQCPLRQDDRERSRSRRRHDLFTSKLSLAVKVFVDFLRVLKELSHRFEGHRAKSAGAGRTAGHTVGLDIVS